MNTNAKGGQKRIEARDVPIFIHCHSRVVAEECKVELGQSEEKIFVKEIQHKFWKSDVVQSSMVKDEIPKELKFVNCKIRVLGCLHAFFPKDPNPNISLHEHGNIVCPVSNRESNLCPVCLFDHSNNICLLTWRYSASNNSVTSFSDLDEYLFIFHDSSEGKCFNYNCSLPMLRPESVVLLKYLGSEEI